MSQFTSVPRAHIGAFAAVSALLAGAFAAPAFAGRDCGSFAVTIGSQTPEIALSGRAALMDVSFRGPERKRPAIG